MRNENENEGITVEYVDVLPEVVDDRPPAPIEGEPIIDTRPLPELTSFCSAPLIRMINEHPMVRMTHGKIRSELSMITPTPPEPWTSESLALWLRMEQRKKNPADDASQLNIAVELPDGTLHKWYPGWSHPDRPDLAPDGSSIPGIPRPVMRGRRPGTAAPVPQTPQAVVATPTPPPPAEETRHEVEVTVPITYTETRRGHYTESRRITGNITIPADVVVEGLEAVKQWLAEWGSSNEDEYRDSLDEVTNETDWRSTEAEVDYDEAEENTLRSRDINIAANAAIAAAAAAARE